MGKLKRILTNWRILLLIFLLVLGFVALGPSAKEGVMINAVAKNSSAMIGGIENPKPGIALMARERIVSMNNKPIVNIQDYNAFVSELDINQTVKIKTESGWLSIDKKSHTLFVKPKIRSIELNETELVNVTEIIQVNETINDTVQLVNKTITKTVERPKILEEVIGPESLGLSVRDAPATNLRKGLDLQGGTRVLLRPAEKVNMTTMELIVDSLKERLNVYGLGDVVVTLVSDRPGFLGEGEHYVLVEIAGATEEEVRDLLSRQGKFEATIGNETVFKGGQDITYVCKTGDCSGIDPRRGCGEANGGWVCGFMFSITLSPEAAERQAGITKNFRIIDNYLEQDLVLYLDDQEVDKLRIDKDLRGRPVTDIAITGSGTGPTQAEAMQDALKNMKRLQTILITGSLPTKLDIQRIDTISPTLGKQFINNALLVGLFAAIAVILILTIVYRSPMLTLPIIITALSEIFLIIAMAALIRWNLDLAAIAGIILAVGTGVDHQIVIADETLRQQVAMVYGWKERIKRAFFIIFSAYLTTVVAMIPLLFAGAGLLKGFAITTILGVSIGVLITRPAYAALVQILFEK